MDTDNSVGIYLFICLFIEGRKGGKREGEKASCVCPNWGLNPQPRQVP